MSKGLCIYFYNHYMYKLTVHVLSATVSVFVVTMTSIYAVDVVPTTFSSYYNHTYDINLS